MTRVLVVLGYSNGARDGLHPVCAARLTKAAELSTDADVVVLSGWSRMPGTRSEAELMARAWHGRAAELVVDPDARTTAENATNALNDIRRVGTTEVVVVTSSWHAARAATAFRWLLRGSGTNVNVVSPPGRSWRASLRELALWPLLPGQLFRARCSRRRGESRFPTA